MKTKTKLSKADQTPGRRGFDCGYCGKGVKLYRNSKKADGWHWHKKCWNKFRTQ